MFVSGVMHACMCVCRCKCMASPQRIHFNKILLFMSDHILTMTWQALLITRQSDRQLRRDGHGSWGHCALCIGWNGAPASVKSHAVRTKISTTLDDEQIRAECPFGCLTHSRHFTHDPCSWLLTRIGVCVVD